MTIDAASTALLVIDILVTESPDAVYATNPEEEALVANAAQLTRAARGAGMPVLFLCDQHIPGIDRELSLWGEHGMRGEAHPHPALEAGSGSRDFVIPKRRYSGFFQTDLDLTLRQEGGLEHMQRCFGTTVATTREILAALPDPHEKR